jgi:hypothetical protein
VRAASVGRPTCAVAPGHSNEHLHFMVSSSREKGPTLSPNFGLAQPPALEQDERKQQKTMMGNGREYSKSRHEDQRLTQRAQRAPSRSFLSPKKTTCR